MDTITDIEPRAEQATAVVADDGIDPRFAARRDDVDRERSARRRSLLTLLGGVAVALLLAIVLLLRAHLFSVHEIHVTGVHHVSRAQVLALAHVSRGTSMWGLDTDAVANRVGKLSWVKSVSVSRQWPNTLDIAVHEYQATAWLRTSDTQVALLGRDGRVLAVRKHAPPGLVEIVGVRRVPPVGAMLYPPEVGSLAPRLPPALVARLVAIDLSGEGINLRLDVTTVRIGDTSQLRAKALAALAVINASSGQCMTYIDVRVPTNPARGC